MLWLAVAFAGDLDTCFSSPEDNRESYRCAYRVARTTNDYDAVIARVQQEVQLHPDHGWGVHTLGSLLTDRGELTEGVVQFEKARTMFDQDGDVLGRVYCRLNLGNHLQHLDRPDDSRAAYLEAAEIAEANDREDLQHAAQLSLARNLVANETHLGEAWELAHRVHDEVFPDGAYQTKLLALSVLQNIAGKTGRGQEFGMMLERRIALAEAEGDAYNQLSAEVALVNTLIDEREWGDRRPETLQHIEKLLTHLAASASSDPMFAAMSWCARARLEMGLGRQGVAQEAAARCVTDVRGLDEPDFLRDALMEHAASTTGETSEASWQEALAMATTDGDRAALTMMRLEMLSERGELAEVRKLLPAVRTAIVQLREGSGDHTSRSALSSTHLQPVEVAAVALAESDPDEALVLADIARGAPAGSETTLSGLQASIPADTTLVVYLVPPIHDRGLAMVVTGASYRVVPIEQVFALPERTSMLTAMIQGQDPLADAVGSRLYDQLIAPLELGTDRVVFFPSRALHGVPFDALGGPERRLSNQRIVTMGSTLAAWRLGSRSPDRVERAVLIADPADPAGALPPLPSALEEVRAVAAALKSPQPVHSGAEATSAMLLDPGADWIHVAAHVVVDDRFPERTAVHLAAGEVLTAAQVREASWNHPTVVLSACRSVAGPVVGDGPLGMGRAFLDAGAASVIGSLWPLRDADAQRFFALFYAHVARGERLDSALTATRRELEASGAPMEAWAGVVLIGDGSRSLTVPSTDRWWLGGALAALFLVLLVAGVVVRRGRS